MSWSILYWMIIHEEQQSDSSHLIDLVGGLLVVSDQLKPDDADPVPPVVVDVLSPGTALNVKHLPGVGIVYLNSHQRALVVILVKVGEVGLREGGILGEVFKGVEALNVSGILSLASHPDLLLGGSLDLVLQRLRHVLREVSSILGSVEVRHEAIDAVQLEDEAGAVRVKAVFALGAVSNAGDGEATKLSLLEVGLLPGAVLGIGDGVVVVRLDKVIGPLDPACVPGHGDLIGLPLVVEQDDAGLDAVPVLARPHSQRRAASNKRVLLLPPGLVIVNKLEEDEEAEAPEGGQEEVVDDVEDGDQGPGLGGS